MLIALKVVGYLIIAAMTVLPTFCDVKTEKPDGRERPNALGYIFLCLTVLGLALSILSDVLDAVDQQEEAIAVRERELADLHVLRDRQTPTVLALPALIDDGGSTIVLYGGEAHGSSITPFIFGVSHDRRVLVNGLIRDVQGVVVAELKDSRLFVPPGRGYDINSDDEALEVVNETGSPVLQVFRYNDRELGVCFIGVRPMKGENGQQLIASVGRSARSRPLAEGDVPLRLPTRTLFRYPGYAHPGARQASNLDLINSIQQAVLR